MAQTAWPFENIDTTETQFSQWARNINEGINQGVGDQLEVTADGTGMTVSVGTGQAMIRGHYYSSTATESLTITAADPTNPRIDSVVLELDPTANTVLLKVLAGTAAGSPVAPTLTQTDAGVYQLRLANIQVDAATLAIESGDVTDLRPKMWSGVGNWTTATRPTNPVANSSIGYNTTTGKHEYWNGTAWVDLSEEVDLSTLIPKSIIDASGDLIIGQSDNTPVRLPRGTDGQVLTATASGINWEALPAGSSYTQLASTTLSGASVTISSIDQSYRHLMITIDNAKVTTSGDRPEIHFNEQLNKIEGTYLTSTNAWGTTTRSFWDGWHVATTETNFVTIFVYNYSKGSAIDNPQGYQHIFALGNYRHPTNGNVPIFGAGAWVEPGAINSVQLVADGAWTAGTVTVFGVK